MSGSSENPQGVDESLAAVFPSGGELALHCRELDWASTPLGPVDDWPESLKAIAGLVVASPFPLIVLWGPDLVQIYNDGYRDVMGAKHPAGLGQPTRDCWPELWEFNAPLYEGVMKRAESYTFEEQRLILERNGYPEEAFFKLGFSPVPDGSGGVGGVLVTVFETTAQVQARHAMESAQEEMKAAHRARAHTEEHLRRVVEQAPVLIAIVEGPTHRFTLANPRYRTVAGRPDILGQSIRDAFPELSDQGIFEVLDQVYETGRSFQSTELPIRIRLRPDRDLEERSFDFTYQPLRDEQNDVYGLLVVGVDVTGKVRARRAIEESSARLNAVMEGLPVGLILTDAEGRITFSNPEIEAVLGHSPLVGGDAVEYFARWTAYHPDGHRLSANEFPLLRALRTAERVHAEEHLYRQPDGHEVWVSVGAAPVLDSRGNVIGGVLTIQGIDEQKLAEQALRQSETRFRAIADLVPDLLWRTDATGATSWYNKRWLEYTGQKPAEAVAFGWTEVIHPDDQAESIARFQAALESGEPVRQEQRIRGADGIYRWFLIQARPVRGEEGQITHWFGAATDVHEQRTALEAAERAESQARRALELEQEARTRSERLQRLSTALALAVTPDEVAEATLNVGLAELGAQVGFFYIPVENGKEACLLAHFGVADATLDEYRQIPIERPLPVTDVLRTGKPLWIGSDADLIDRYPLLARVEEGPLGRSVAALPVSSGDRNRAALALAFPDSRELGAPERSNLEAIAALAGQALDRALLFQAERSARAESDRANHAKDEFLAVMSHELRTPLTGITGYAELLADEVSGPLTDAQRQQVERIRAGAWHLVSIIEEILTLSRAEAGKEEVRWGSADLAKVVREVVDIVEPQATTNGLRIRLEDVKQPLQTWTDAGKVRQILINIVGNAVKYTEHGEVIVVVDRSNPERLDIHVRDTGPGIAPHDQERVFEAFTQLDSSYTRRRPGTGLGLAICRRLARLVGGEVSLQSTVGQGSVFTLSLPRRTRE